MGNRRVIRWGRDAEIRFAETVSMLLTATLTMSETLNSASRMRNLGVAREVAELAAQAHAVGFSIADVLRSRLSRLDPVHRAMWQAFDATGATEPLIRSAGLMRSWLGLRQRIVTALIYPGCVVSLMTIGVGILVFFVLPSASSSLVAFGAEIAPLLDQVRVAGRIYLAAVGGLASCVAVAVAARLSNVAFLEWARTASDWLGTSLPLFRRPARLRSLYCLAIAASAVCEGGGTLDEGLICGAATIPSELLRTRAEEAVRSVRDGAELSEAFARLLRESGAVVRWFELIDHGGDPALIFAGLSRHLEASLDLLASRISAAAEPATIGVAGIVMIVVVANLILPLIQMYGGLLP